jgi:Domain of Unknown Function (DUF748)
LPFRPDQVYPGRHGSGPKMAGNMFHPIAKSRALRILIWMAGILVFLIVLAIILPYVASGPLRKHVQGNINHHLKAYQVSIGQLRFHTIGFTADLYHLQIIQKGMPNPPVADIPHLAMGVHWKAIMHGRLVADLTIDEPKIHFDIRNVEVERQNHIPIKTERWQQAIESVYPLKIDVLTVHDAELTYITRSPYKPLHMSHLNIVARNIRNIYFPNHVYPSSVHLDGIIFGTGKIALDGNANFLAVPHVTGKGEFKLQQMKLGYFSPITDRYNLAVTGGLLSTAGHFEYGIKDQIYRLGELSITDVKVDFIHPPRTPSRVQHVAKEAAKTAKRLANQPTVTTEIKHLAISDSDFGFVNKAASAPYRVFISHTDLQVENFSNQFLKGPARFKLTGRFMGSGATQITGVFRPEKQGPDFDLNIAIEHTEMRPMSPLFRAYGNFAIQSGFFSFYSQLSVKGKAVNGYVKPLFKNMQVTDKRTKNEKSLFHKVYVGILKALSELLENPQEKVATRVHISGSQESPHLNTLQAIENLIRNAFFKSILPGFSKSIHLSER